MQDPNRATYVRRKRQAAVVFGRKHGEPNIGLVQSYPKGCLISNSSIVGGLKYLPVQRPPSIKQRCHSLRPPVEDYAGVEFRKRLWSAGFESGRLATETDGGMSCGELECLKDIEHVPDAAADAGIGIEQKHSLLAGSFPGEGERFVAPRVGRIRVIQDVKEARLRRLRNPPCPEMIPAWGIDVHAYGNPRLMTPQGSERIAGFPEVTFPGGHVHDAISCRTSVEHK